MLFPRPGRLPAVAVTAALLATLAPSAAVADDVEDDRTNVILLIADGMGYNHIDAASLYEHGTAAYQDQADNPYLAAHGSDSVTSEVYQEFETQLSVDTGYVFSPEYSTIDAWGHPQNATRDQLDGSWLNVTDSGAAATALSTGVRTRGGYLGWDRDEEPLTDMVDIASEHGLATGVVTSGQFWGDTSAGFAVHADDGDEDLIIDQLLRHEDLDVVMGGGHPAYSSDGEAQTPSYHNIPREDWEAIAAGDTSTGLAGWTLVDERADFQALATGDTPDQVLGVAQTAGALTHDRSGDREIPNAAPVAENVARLPELAAASLNVLSNASDDGFFAMIEQANVDGAGHAGELGRTIENMLDFNATVDAVVEWVDSESSWEETTVIVTSDHETGNLWGGGTLGEDGIEITGEFQPLTGTAGELPAAEFTDFTDLKENENEETPHYHTHQIVPFFARGAAAEEFAAVADSTDPVRGDYLENTDIAEVIHAQIRAAAQEPDPEPEPEPEPPAHQDHGFFLSNDWEGTTHHAFRYGRYSDDVLIGDWDGDGTDSIAVRRGNIYLVSNAPRGGSADRVLSYGRESDVVLVGDWDGDGADTLAVRRGNAYFVANSLGGGNADHELRYGRSGDEVLVGDWDGDATDTFAVRRGNAYFVADTLDGGDADRTFEYGRSGDVTLAGDWDGDGTDTFAVRRGNAYFVKNSLSGGNEDVLVHYGRSGDEVLVGDWDGDGADTLGLRRAP
ncbi:alkaline phosphatase [Georgenia sp. Z1344]|uniref:alkaline phosphatase n=1 Tax=Georgenia sp. Z1344 TaxID=3416706 RepID=UPI003CEB2EA9